MILNGLSLYIPKLEDYWYEQRLKGDAETMRYNAGYDVAYFGYHYDTGCIDFPRERWQATFERRIRENRFFAYVLNGETGEFVGYVNYQYNKSENRHECGVVIEGKHRGKGYGRKALALLADRARADGVKALYDNFEKDRPHAVRLFLSEGFFICQETVWKKFGEDVAGVVVRIDL